jgi:hypothetical protein
MSSSRKGNTLIEVMVGCVILGLLMTLLFQCFRSGAGAWKKVEAQAELIGDLQVTASLLDREFERTSPASVTLDATGTGMAFLSPLDDTGQYTCDVNGRLEWKAYCVCWYDAAGKTLMWRKFPLVAGAPERLTAGPIQDYDDGSGKKALAAYYVNGRVVARHVDACTFARAGLGLQFNWLVQRKRYGSERLESVRMVSQITPRN